MKLLNKIKWLGRLLPAAILAAVAGCGESPFDRSTDLGRDIIRDTDGSIADIGFAAEAMRLEVPVVGTSGFVYDRQKILESVESERARDSIFARLPAGLSGSHAADPVIMVGTHPATGEYSIGYVDFLIPPLNRNRIPPAAVEGKTTVLSSAVLEVVIDTSGVGPLVPEAFRYPEKHRYAPITENFPEENRLESRRVGVDSLRPDTVFFFLDSATVHRIGSDLRSKYDNRDTVPLTQAFAFRNAQPEGLIRLPKSNAIRLRLRYEPGISSPDTVLLISKGDYTIVAPGPDAQTGPVSSWAEGRQAVYTLDLSDYFNSARSKGGRLAASAHLRVAIDSVVADPGGAVTFRFAITEKKPDAAEPLLLSSFYLTTWNINVAQGTRTVDLPITGFVNAFFRNGTTPSSAYLVLGVNLPSQDTRGNLRYTYNWTRVHWTDLATIRLESVLYTQQAAVR